MEYNLEDVPPAYGLEQNSTSSNPFHAAPSDRGLEGETSGARRGPYMPPAGPSESYTDMARPGYGYDKQPSYYEDQGGSGSRGVSPLPPSPYTTALGPSYAHGQSPYDASGPSRGYPSSPASGFGLGGSGGGRMGMLGGSRLGGRMNRFGSGGMGTSMGDSMGAGMGGGSGGGMGRLGGRRTGKGRVGIIGMLVNAATNDSSRDMAQYPPPPSFSRSPQPQFPYSPFPPLVAVSVDKSLDHGFPLVPPPSHLQPHPFMAHDINEDDWTSFLSHIRQIGAVSPSGSPGQANTGILGTLVSKGIDTAFKGDKSGTVAQVIEQWNTYFFHPRLTEINLVHGHRVYTNSGQLPPDIRSEGYSRSRDEDSSDDSDSSSEDDNRGGSWMSDRREQKSAKKQAKRDRKDEKRATKRDRRDNKRNGRDTKDEPWKLVVAYRPLAAM
ncbi:uncharacterized protein PHACADRAFT_253474 [Phanerochaete carnosa HHB-10118-sp]|uniref:Uncharacterized protein n=1 Tax=Phanerochaete carnosa (strain HHB-10118-sp) TaxID=650164 RepID=K5WBP4_PHACS|nr:uncharacterized protein PHACADRAFT_253474 [Phanerochaete carnosa HHB-10118-sp]EKM56389.1 hypothetical protein PHACADRAFT_253474 [Phanerochaete carnosa HHB-10118-sp]